MEDVHVRRDVWTLEPGAEGAPWDEHLLAYARAMRVMNGRDPDDPLSFMGQASAYLGRPRGTWFLLPWVRMHLWYFERIVRAVVAETGGPRDWTLPYWGYADAGSPGAAALPPAFAAPALPDGTPNPLYRPDGERAAFLNAGESLPAAVTSAARALAAPAFSPGLGGAPGGPGPGSTRRRPARSRPSPSTPSPRPSAPTARWTRSSRCTSRPSTGCGRCGSRRAGAARTRRTSTGRTSGSRSATPTAAAAA